ncbi:DoxX family protein [Streptomyces sp. NA04227]|uniref:DoxX family protein n=1 Tax=Streptomyces sp. NA04227 TaxID=2742136 RepID=UPI00159156C3|nr:DoxX family protein [Streptomyces sp. NA04227]QKW08128.1 DoxX family protein [Streptomyces sp. NA04227]
MTVNPDPWWPQALLAAVILGDAALSLRPPGFIRGCLNGVGFPDDWWWTLVVIKVLAGAGLILGISSAGLGLAANAGVVVYFVVAAYAHIRARYMTSEFWINCLGMLGLSAGALVVSYAHTL